MIPRTRITRTLPSLTALVLGASLALAVNGSEDQQQQDNAPSEEVRRQRTDARRQAAQERGRAAVQRRQTWNQDGPPPVPPNAPPPPGGYYQRFQGQGGPGGPGVPGGPGGFAGPGAPGGFGGGDHGPHFHFQSHDGSMGMGFGGPPMPPHMPHSSSAEFSGGLEGMVRFWDDETIVSELGLAQEQVDLLEESYQEARAAVEELSQDSPYAALREALAAEDPDLDAVNDAVDHATQARARLMKALLGHRVAVKNALSPEQEEQLRELRTQRLVESRDLMRDMTELLREVAPQGITPEERAALEAELSAFPDPLRERLEPRLERMMERMEQFAPHRVPGPPQAHFQQPGYGGSFDGRRQPGQMRRPGGPGGAYGQPPVPPPPPNGEERLPELPE